MKLKTIIATAAATSAVTYGTYELIASKFFDEAFNKNPKNENDDVTYNAWLKESNVVSVNIESFDGLKLNAYLMKNHENSNYIIMVHGIHGCLRNEFHRGYEFDKLGYNLLMIDQRASGKSEGKYYSYGFKESMDVVQWVDFIINRDSNAKIILYGLSMGAATVMTALINKLPNNVKCVIEDCGFSSTREEIRFYVESRKNIKLPELFYTFFNFKIKNNLGFGFDEMNPKKSLLENEIPIMFIHGTSDEIVPYEHALRCYNSNKGIKKFYRVENALHAQCYMDENYYNNIDTFIKKYI